jgi:hypothetical protein
MRDDTDDYTFARHLVEYLLWLFRHVMFRGSQGDVPYPLRSDDYLCRHGADPPDQMGLRYLGV